MKTLSDKARTLEDYDDDYGFYEVDYYSEHDVKEFIKELLEESVFVTQYVRLKELIEKLAGDKLIGNVRNVSKK